jgi:glycerol-3-phosphate cytidylyltransferase
MGLVVYTGGTFDLPHSGHVRFLQKCAQLGEVYVALNTDEFIEKYKGKPPVMSYAERKAVLEEYKSVTYVIPNEGGQDSTLAINRVCPDIIAIGSDWARKDYYKQMAFTQDWLDENEISLIYIPYTQGISTTELKKRLRDRMD